MWSRSLKDDIRRVDRERLLERCMVQVPIVAEVEERVGWARLWDATLNFGVQHTRALQMLSRVMSHHGRGDHLAPSVMLHHWTLSCHMCFGITAWS